jgi:hypothetical protein
MLSCGLNGLAARLEKVASKSSHHATVGDARVQLVLVQQLELALQQAVRQDMKDIGHMIMTSLLKLLERTCSCPVRPRLFDLPDAFARVLCPCPCMASSSMTIHELILDHI